MLHDINLSRMQLLREDVSFIRHVVLHFIKQDDRRSLESGNRSNYNALRRVWALPYLQSLEILTGDVGKGWGINKEFFFGCRQGSYKVRWP